MFKKSFCFMLCGSLFVAATSSLCGGEFNWNKFVQLRNAKDIAGMKAYAEANQQIPTTLFGKYRFLASRLVLGGVVNKTITIENLYGTIDQLVDQSTNLTDNEKLVVKTYLYDVGWWFAGFKNADVKDIRLQKLTPIINDDAKFNIILNNIIPGCTNIFTLCKMRSDYLTNIKKIAKADRYRAFNDVVNLKGDKETIIFVGNELINNIQIINTPAKLIGVLKTVGKLNNPEYDEMVKTLLTVLNRQCYPNIQINEQWKQAVVQLQLIMKSYSL